MDTGADIIIMGPELFNKVAAVVGLKNKPADKQLQMYDRCQFRLDGRLDLDVSFNDKMMHTSVYVKSKHMMTSFCQKEHTVNLVL